MVIEKGVSYFHEKVHFFPVNLGFSFVDIISSKLYNGYYE